jgi:hypothetical protein
MSDLADRVNAARVETSYDASVMLSQSGEVIEPDDSGAEAILAAALRQGRDPVARYFAGCRCSAGAGMGGSR